MHRQPRTSRTLAAVIVLAAVVGAAVVGAVAGTGAAGVASPTAAANRGWELPAPGAIADADR